MFYIRNSTKDISLLDMYGSDIKDNKGLNFKLDSLDKLLNGICQRSKVVEM